jgi:hypothetical protein
MKPKTKEKEYSRKAKRMRGRMDAIEAKYPHIDFTNAELRRDMANYANLMRELVYATVNRDYCKSDDPDRMCETCNCWKQIRASTM